MGSGHHWLARRVPHDNFFVTGNQGRFKASRSASAPRAPLHTKPSNVVQGMCKGGARALPLSRNFLARQLRRPQHTASWRACAGVWRVWDAARLHAQRPHLPCNRRLCQGNLTISAWPLGAGDLAPTQEVDLSDFHNVLHSPGLLEFAAAVGLWRPSSGRPFSFFEAFMTNSEADQAGRWPGAGTLLRAVGSTGPCVFRSARAGSQSRLDALPRCTACCGGLLREGWRPCMPAHTTGACVDSGTRFQLRRCTASLGCGSCSTS